MNHAFPTVEDREGALMHTATQILSGASSCMRLVIVACVAILLGCTPTRFSTIDDVWLDPARGHTTLGKTLVLARFPEIDVAIPLEKEWVRQLRERGIQADAIESLQPGMRPPGTQRVVELVKAGEFDTVLVTKLLGGKTTSRDVSSYQVAVVEVILYDARTEQPFWKAKSDTFMVSPGGNRVPNPRGDLIRDFVNTVIQQLSRSKLL